MELTIIDAMMGRGKTNYIIDYMNKRHRREQFAYMQHDAPEPFNYIVVVPFLSEVDRFKTACPDLDFFDPQPVGGRKLNHLLELIESGRNICTTHALFSQLSTDVYESIKGRNYILVIDEVLECVTPWDAITAADRKGLFTNDYVSVEDKTCRLRWNYKEHSEYRGRFEDIRNLCDNGNLIYFRNSSLLWEFPSGFFQCFKEGFILTYLFRYSQMAHYLRAEDIQYSLRSVDERGLIHIGEANEREIKANLRELITIVEGNINNVGANRSRANPFSASWCRRRSNSELKQLRATTCNYFRKVAKTPSKLNGWTCFKSVRSKLKGGGYSRGWIASNAKATNDYRDRVSLAYLCNVYVHPMIKGYFDSKGVEIDEEMFALSEMVQWIWRSAIRDMKPITIFIPSERMRNLLKLWLNADSLRELMMQRDFDLQNKVAA